MPRATTWGLAFGVSLSLHAGAAGIYLATKSLNPPPEQTSGQSKLQLDTVTAPRQNAIAREPESESASEQAPDSPELAAGAVPQADAQQLSTNAEKSAAITPPSANVAATPPPTDALANTPPPSSQLTAAPPPSSQLTATAPPKSQIAATAPPVSQLAAMPPRANQIAAAPPPVSQLAATPPPANNITATSAPAATLRAEPAIVAAVPVISPASTTLAAATVTAATLQTVAPTGERAPQSTAQGERTTLASARGDVATQTAPQGTDALEPPLPATSTKATVAWQFQDRVVTDPTAIATIQAFMAPDALQNSAANAGEVKDGLSDVLAGIDCARVSATYVPETGALEMRGHIPDPAMRQSIVDAMQKEVGEGIIVTSNLLHLPSPQCGALTGIADIGLPQSTDQFTNDRLIGETAQAREYDYSEGQRLQFDLVAPDYAAYVYIDYFNADGEVIHLAPNDTIPLKKHDPQTVFGVGKDLPGQPGLRLIIGPPYGQEIAVAFASSTQLYDGLRPIVEPSEPYLAFLKSQIADARARDSDFKGEWVYFFITTSAATQ